MLADLVFRLNPDMTMMDDQGANMIFWMRLELVSFASCLASGVAFNANNHIIAFDWNQGRKFENDYLASILHGSYFSVYRQDCIVIAILIFMQTTKADEFDWSFYFMIAHLALIVLVGFGMKYLIQ
jgi:hypothetical protein